MYSHGNNGAIENDMFLNYEPDKHQFTCSAFIEYKKLIDRLNYLIVEKVRPVELIRDINELTIRILKEEGRLIDLKTSYQRREARNNTLRHGLKLLRNKLILEDMQM